MRGGERFEQPQKDARRFLAAAADFDDGAELVYRLTSSEEYGAMQLRAALSADTSVEFVRDHVQPLLERLGSDELHLGTCKQV